LRVVEHTFYLLVMPISPQPDMCAVLVRDHWGRYGGNCEQPPTSSGQWRFIDHTAPILLCDRHAAELGGHDRLTALSPIEHR
jgi:hypothetical protein